MKAKYSINSLEAQLKKTTSDLEDLQHQRSQVDQKINNMNRILNEVNYNIRAMKGDGLIVTEHAMIRYLQRVDGLNIEALKERILGEETLKQHKVLGDGKFPIKGGGLVVIKDNVIVTIID